MLQNYDWTGNIRELRNVVERLIILGEKEVSETDVKLFASKADAINALKIICFIFILLILYIVTEISPVMIQQQNTYLQ